MINRDIYVPPSGPPQGPGPNKELYSIMGEEAIYQLLEDFYLQLEKSEISGMFPDKDFVASSRKSADFFIGLMGGPPVYMQKYGPPRMRMRHIPFEIDENARQVWLQCFFTVLEDYEKYGMPEKDVAPFKTFLEGFSAWMVNKL